MAGQNERLVVIEPKKRGHIPLKLSRTTIRRAYLLRAGSSRQSRLNFQ